MLFQKMNESNKHDSVKIIKTDIGCSSMTAFLRSKNIGPEGKQFGMIKKVMSAALPALFYSAIHKNRIGHGQQGCRTLFF